MDSAVASSLTAQLTTFQGDVFTQLGTVLPLAIPVAITIALAFMGIRWFRAVAHV